MKFLALKSKSGFNFLCVSRTKEEFNKKVDQFYWDRKGMKPKGSEFSKEDLLLDYIEVLVDIKSISSTAP